MNTPESKQIMERFFCALDTLVAKRELRGINTYCSLYDIDRRNLLAQRKNLDRGYFQLSWISPLLKEYRVSARWLFTGLGGMFE